MSEFRPKVWMTKKHGTIMGISKNVVSLEPKEFIIYSRAGTAGTKGKKNG